MVLPVIDRPGTYRLRNGQCVLVVYSSVLNPARRLWYGHLILRMSLMDERSGVAFCWSDDGQKMFSGMSIESPYDVVGRAGVELLVMAGGEFAEPI